MENNNPQRSSCAYGTFLFRDGGYLPGLLMVAYQVKKLGLNGARLVCCYTPDIDQSVVNALKLIYDDVWPVEYLEFGRKRKGRQAPRNHPAPLQHHLN